MSSSSYLFPFNLYWAMYILGSISIVVVYDRLTRDEHMVGIQVWRHWWHIPLLLLITFISGWIFGFSLYYLQNNPWWVASEALVLWWLAAFALSHLGWLALMIQYTHVKKISGQTD